LAAIGLGAASPALAESGPCGHVAHAEASYVVCRIDLRRYALKLFLRDAEGEPYGGFARLLAAPEGRGLVFAMNAGMYDRQRLPIGLYVQDGRLIKRANTANGAGNFHLKPNGVFYVAGNKAGILETSRYLALAPRADLATQSGPMLVIDGRIHPKFDERSTSRKLRNGVGVDGAHMAVFAISDQPVTFAAFAHLFRDALDCRDALFLDGSISSLYAPGIGRDDELMPMGPIIGALPR
jgi:uncharacterized protein YigE (DUF2233 family)